VKKGIVVQLAVPTALTILVIVVAMGWLIARQMVSQIEVLANEQVNGRIGAIQQNLGAVHELSLDKVKASMRYFMELGNAQGSPLLSQHVQVGTENVPGLIFGRTPQGNNFTLVDQVKKIMGGTATLFVKRGTDFIRVSTNVKKPDGSRAVGTLLDSKGNAFAAVHDDKSFYGVVDILGSPFMTGYEPMKNKQNEIIGIWYVGYPLSSLNQLGESITKARILEHGFVALLDAKGKLLFKSDNVSGEEIQNILKMQEKSAEEWSVMSEPFAAWGYSVVVAYPKSDLTKDVTNVYIVVAVVAFVVVALLIGIIFVLIRRIVLHPLTEVIGKMDNADLNTALNSNRTDEIGSLQIAFDRFVFSIKETLMQVSESAAAVASASSEISSSTEEMAAGAQKQTSQAGEVASAVEEMTNTIVENSKNASNTADTAKQARMSAEEGGKIVESTVVGMKRIADVVNKSAETVKALGQSSNQIGEIIGVIDDIADQTNLLALNAAIEAARAGEQGRGFAVVADEVRKLAERTTKATKEIADMIKKIQSETVGAVSSMEEGTKEVDNGIQLADKAGSSLQEIVTISQKVMDMVTQIAAASEEQSSASEQISKNVEAISSVTSESAQGTQQIAHAAEDLNRLTENLQQLVGKFNLSDESTQRGQAQQYKLSIRKTEPKSKLAVRENGSLVPHEEHQ
jgi:methyl-accepting chemotaxis protein